MTRKLITGLLIGVLLAVSLFSLLNGEEFMLPPKLIVLFLLLAVAAVSFRLKLFWMRYLTLITSVIYLGFYEGSCICPNGALQNISLYLATSKAARIGIYLFEVSVIMAVVFWMGNLYCGWVCQKGGIQEFLFRRRLAVRIPPKIDAGLRNLRFVFLGIAVAYPIFQHEKIFGRIDPFKAAFNLTGTPTLVVLLGITLLASLFIYRPFCRYICPFGALLGIVNSLGLFKLRFNGKCSGCRLCERTCSLQAVHVDAHPDTPRVNRSVCIACMDCVLACPGNIREKKLRPKRFPVGRRHKPALEPAGASRVEYSVVDGAEERPVKA